LFYFELDFMPEGYNKEYTGTSTIFCLVYRSDPIFILLLDQLSNTIFYLNNCSIPGQIGDYSFIYKNRNFRKRIKLNLSGRFMISFKQSDAELCNISRSPYLIDKLILAQGLDAYFRRVYYRKKKSLAEYNLPARKRLRI
jgi:hypothetical protein